jgi:transposase
MLKKWVANFRDYRVAAFQARYTNYSVEFKIDVINYINQMGASIEEATSVFKIPSSSTVWQWVDLYETKGIDALQPQAKGRPSLKKSKENQTEKSLRPEDQLRAENEKLRMEIAYLKKLYALIQEKVKSPKKTKRK